MPFLDCNGIKYKITHEKGAVDKMLSHFITAPLSLLQFQHDIKKSFHDLQRIKKSRNFSANPVEGIYNNFLL